MFKTKAHKKLWNFWSALKLLNEFSRALQMPGGHLATTINGPRVDDSRGKTAQEMAKDPGTMSSLNQKCFAHIVIEPTTWLTIATTCGGSRNSLASFPTKATHSLDTGLASLEPGRLQETLESLCQHQKKGGTPPTKLGQAPFLPDKHSSMP